MPIAPVAITGTVNVCGVTSGTYSVGGVAGATGYQWTATGTGMSISGSATGLSVTVLTDGLHGGTLTCKATNVCGQGPARTLTLTVPALQPVSVSGPTNICGMSTATYTTAAVGVAGAGYTYTWTLSSMIGWSITSGNGTNTITVTGPAVTTNPVTTGLVNVKSTNTCSTTPSNFRTLTVTSCHDAIGMNGTTTESGSNFSAVYPNPTSSAFAIDATLDADQEVTVEVYDILGNLLVQQKHQLTTGANTMKTNIESYKDGMYFVRILGNESNVLYTQRVIKQ